MNWDSPLLVVLLAAVLRPLVLVAAALLAIRVFRIRHPASQHAVWTAVFIGLLLVPILSSVVPHFELAILPAQGVLDAAQPQRVSDARLASAAKDASSPEIDPLLLHEQGVAGLSTSRKAVAAGLEAGKGWSGGRFRGVSPLLYIYFAGFFLLAAYYVVGWFLLRRLFSRSERLALKPLFISSDVMVPAAVGAFRPIVILPRDWRTWSFADRRAVLAHEFAHIRRKDLLTASVVRCVKCAFWFNPLVWWVSRKISRLAEMACDAEALRRTNDPAAYSRILLDFAQRVNQAGYRATAPGLAMAGSSGLRARIDTVFSISSGDVRKLARPGFTLMLAGVPLISAAAILGLGQTPVVVRTEVPAALSIPASSSPERALQIAAVYPAPVEPIVAPAAVQSVPAVQSLLNDYCIRRHNAQLSAAGVALDNIAIENPATDARKWERVLRTLRGRSMPPVGAPHPDRGTNDAIVAWLERALDANASPSTWPVRTESLSDSALAIRMSNFLWGTGPDEQLNNLADRGSLKDTTVIEQQVKRMIADPKSGGLVTSFFAGWLGLRRLPSLTPAPDRFPDFDEGLRAAMQRETEMFLDSQLHDDRSALELVTANYTFVNDRLARHYGIPNVSGSEFRRISLNDGRRAGILGQASILTLTSLSNRVSPNLRGKWILMNILGQVPPDPPPSVSPFPEDEPGKTTPIRPRMEQHLAARASCVACHAIIDPPGYALENFNAIGQWQDSEAAVPIDASGTFPDGTLFNGPAEFRAALMDRREAILNNIAEKLLTYALGRLADNSTAPKVRALEYYEMPAVRTIVRGSAPTNYRWSDLITAVVKSAPFQSRVLESK